MKVAHIKSPFLPITETFIYNYINSLKKYEPIIISEYQQNHEQFPVEHIIVQRNENLFYEPYLVTIRNWLSGKIQKEFFFNNFYSKSLKAAKPNIVHIHFGFPGILYSTIVKKLKLPLLVSFYGYDLSSLPYTLGEDVYIRNKLFSSGQIFTAEGKFAVENLVKLGCPREKVRLLRIGININDYKYIPRDYSSSKPIKLLFCGRFVPKKGLLMFIEVIAMAIDNGVPIIGNIIGFGPQEKIAEDLVENLGIQKNVNFLGMKNHKEFIEECYNNHIFVAPSQKDINNGETEGGAPTVILEAQATGMPIIGSTHADIPNIMDQDSGVVFQEGNKDSLYNAIIEVIDKHKFWGHMGKCGRKFVHKYHDIEIVVDQLESFYDELLES